MEPTGFDHQGPDHSGPSSRGALPSARMSTKEVMKALGRHTEESHESDRQTATKLGGGGGGGGGGGVDERARLLRIQSEADEYPVILKSRASQSIT